MKLRLKELCKERGITLTDLAIRVGINKVTIYYYVSGRSFPTKRNLAMMAKSLNVDVSELFAPQNAPIAPVEDVVVEEDVAPPFIALVSYKDVNYRFDDIESLKLRLSEWEQENNG